MRLKPGLAYRASALTAVLLLIAACTKQMPMDEEQMPAAAGGSPEPSPAPTSSPAPSPGTTPTPAPGASPTPSPVPSNVFFYEDFEAWSNDTFISQYYGNMSSPRYQIQTNATYVARGTRSLRHSLVPGEAPASLTQHFGDAPLSGSQVWNVRRGEHFNDVYIQYKVKYPPGFDFGNGTKQLIIGTQDDRSHGSTPCCNPWVSHYLFTIVYSSGNPAYGILGTEGNNKLPTRDARSGFPNTPWLSSHPNQWFDLHPNMAGYSEASNNWYRIYPGQWYTIEVRRSLNTGWDENGIFELWVNGQQITRYTNLLWRFPNTGAYGANMAYGTNYVMVSDWVDPVPQNEDVYYDDIKISPTFIPFD